MAAKSEETGATARSYDRTHVNNPVQHGAVGQGRHRGWKRSAGLADGPSGQLNGNNANNETPPTSALQCLVCLLWGSVETCSATQWTHAKVTEHTGDTNANKYEHFAALLLTMHSPKS